MITTRPAHPGIIVFSVQGQPISANATYRHGKGHSYISAKGKAWKDAVTVRAKSAMGKNKPLLGEVTVSMDFHFQTRANDVDGPIKPTLDAMQGVIFENDRQVNRLFVTKSKAGPGGPFVSVTVHSEESLIDWRAHEVEWRLRTQ